jgi:hypothetical protein
VDESLEAFFDDLVEFDDLGYHTRRFYFACHEGQLSERNSCCSWVGEQSYIPVEMASRTDSKSPRLYVALRQVVSRRALERKKKTYTPI